jgi:hypothetical protein
LRAKDLNERQKRNGRPSTFTDAGSRFPERRSFPRYQVDALAEIVEPISKTHLSGRVSQISEGGCYISLENGLPSKTIFQIRILLKDRVFESWSQVTFLREGIGMGVAFLRTDQSNRAILQSWLPNLVLSTV